MTEAKKTTTKKTAKTPTNIFTALAEAQAAIGAVGKDGQNAYDRYAYRTIDDVMNAAHRAFVAAGVVAVPEVLEKEQIERQSKRGELMIHTTLTVRYSFFAQDGTSVSAVVQGEGMDRGDKSINKAMSAAYKYAMFQTLAIPTSDMIDSETESPQIAGPAPQQAPQPPRQASKTQRQQTKPQASAPDEDRRRADLIGQINKAAVAAGEDMDFVVNTNKGRPVEAMETARLEKCLKWLQALPEERRERALALIDEHEFDLQALEEEVGRPFMEWPASTVAHFVTSVESGRRISDAELKAVIDGRSADELRTALLEDEWVVEQGIDEGAFFEDYLGTPWDQATAEQLGKLLVRVKNGSVLYEDFIAF